MSRDYGKVRAQFWDDDILRELSIEANFLALYLITSRHTNAIGCFRLPAAYIINDTRLDKKALEKALAELREAGYALPCERGPWIYIPKFLRHNSPENPNVWRKCVKELDELPGEVTAAASIAAELFDLAGDERMCRDGAKGRVSEEERTKLKRFADRSETVSKRLLPLSLPNHSEPNHLTSAFADPSKHDPQPEPKRISYPEAFEAFWREYPTDALMSKKKAHAQWCRLDQASRDAARAAIPAFKDHCRKNPTYRPVHAERFISERRFDGFNGGNVTQLSPEQIAANIARRDAMYGPKTHKATA